MSGSLFSGSFVGDNGQWRLTVRVSQVPACNSLHCRVLVPDSVEHCPPAAITLIVCILRGPYEHSLAFTDRLRSHFTFVNYFVVFGVTQRVGLILKGGRGGGLGGWWSGVCRRRGGEREHLGTEQQESPRSNRVPLWIEMEKHIQEKGSRD